MKVLIADKLPPAGLDGFSNTGFEVLSEPELKGDALPERVASSGAQILVVRSTKVPRATLKAGKLGLVIRAGDLTLSDGTAAERKGTSEEISAAATTIGAKRSLRHAGTRHRSAGGKLFHRDSAALRLSGGRIGGARLFLRRFRIGRM